MGHTVLCSDFNPVLPRFWMLDVKKKKKNEQTIRDVR